MSKLRIQQYMDKHRLTPLFEDLMNKVLHEQPDDPVVYLIKCLYRKSGLPVPKDLKGNSLRRSSPERPIRRSKSPEKSSTQAWAVASGPDLVDRSYDKPWLSHTKKNKSKDEERAEPRQGRKQKSGWVSDTKVTTTTFDELFEEDYHQKIENSAQRRKTEENTDIKKAWARHVDLDDSEDPNYRSRGYSGPRCHRNKEDPLEGEIKLAKEEQTEECTSSSCKTKPMGAKLEAAKHRQELEKIIQDSDKVSIDSGFYGDRNVDEQDDAIELLEDPDDLMREGVTNIPKSGYKLSRVLRQRKEEANVKLNINMAVNDDKKYGDYYESDVERPPSGMSIQSNKFSRLSPDVSDDDFESVSQVVGPRQPVWTVPDSDGEPVKIDNSKKRQQSRFNATAPVKREEKLTTQASVESENIFLEGNKTWSPGQGSQNKEKMRSSQNLRDSARSFRSQDGKGWNIPDDTEVSVTSRWSETPTSARQSPGPPKAY